ncbi:uncharacterized protein LOC125885641, partial [Epinephelus fuscoguttatus]|uniref:uncharacterized protein LOC125885641 n=1 Tax=Epinephelus fuscoguttatus TaxID=293821 RepID=UPI0020D004DF
FSDHIQLNPNLANLTHTSQETILNSLAPSTLSAYLTGWNSFKNYHTTYHLPFPSLDALSMCNFITHCHTVTKIRASSIQTYLAGINLFHKLSTGLPCQSISHAHVTLLCRCIHTLRSGYISLTVDLTLESMFLLAFFGFLRCSEFAPTSSVYNPSRHPSLSDITTHTSDSLIFTLRSSKTDQLGVTFPIYIFRLNSFLSPHEPLTRYIHTRYSAHASPQDPLFLTETGRMATRFWFQKHFHNILRLSGISSDHYSCHSFRIGAASSAARSGISDQVIQVLGRWSSQAYQTYIHNNLNDLRLAHNRLSLT